MLRLVYRTRLEGIRVCLLIISSNRELVERNVTDDIINRHVSLPSSNRYASFIINMWPVRKGPQGQETRTGHILIINESLRSLNRSYAATSQLMPGKKGQREHAWHELVAKSI
jgi:hypothetical protein